MQQHLPKQLNHQYAGFWPRVAAFIIDCLILSLISVAFREALLPLPVDSRPFATGVVCLLYQTCFESSSLQATPGKLAMNLIVTDVDGNRISFVRGLARNLALSVSSLILGIGYLMVAFTGKHQGLHDMIANCLVLTKR